MKPRPIHTRSDLVALIRDHVPTRACGRAVDEDRATVLGGFIAPEGLPYWLVKVTSRFGRVWYIGVVCNEAENRFEIVYPEAPDWRHWDGRSDGRRLKDGDDPKTHALNRAKARKTHATPQENEDR